MVNYKELGLVNTRDMFARAIKGGYAIPAFNFNNLEQLQAIIKASSELKSPVILQVSKGARAYANETLLRYMAEGAVEYAKDCKFSSSSVGSAYCPLGLSKDTPPFSVSSSAMAALSSSSLSKSSSVGT